MTDTDKSKQNEHEPQAPKYMRPRRPVLDEPLDGFPEETEDHPEEPDVQPPAELTSTQEIKPSPESAPQEDWIDVQAPSQPEVPHSPYFPHGIYEDARTVEAFYGRDASSKPVQEGQPPVPVPLDEPQRKPLARWLVLLFALLMILALLFLALTGRIPLGFF